jgi:hypothetical protein
MRRPCDRSNAKQNGGEAWLKCKEQDNGWVTSQKTE